MTISLLNDNNPAALSVDAAIAAARRPHAGCEAVRSVKLVQSATASGGAAAITSPLATDPCFEFHEAPVVVAPFSQQPPRTPVRTVAPSSPPLSPLFGARKPSTTATTSTLGRLDPPPPLVLLPPPPAFDRLGAAAKLTAPPSPQPLAPAPPLQQRVSLAPMLTEELTLTFRGSGSSGEVRVALRGHVQLGVVATGGATRTEAGAEAEALPPLEVDVALSDRAGQVAASAPSPAAAALFVKTEQPPAPSSAAAIPEAKDDDTTLAAMNNDPSPASSSYRCRIPRDRFASSSSSSSLLDLLRYEAKPSVRPVPVRIQQSLVRVEAGKEPGVAHVVAQVSDTLKTNAAVPSRTNGLTPPSLPCHAIHRRPLLAGWLAGWLAGRWPSTPRSSCRSSPPPSPASSSSQAWRSAR